jgi:hypothetical protein
LKPSSLSLAPLHVFTHDQGKVLNAHIEPIGVTQQCGNEGRLVTWKNYIQIDRTDGSMHCPGRQDLSIKAGGRFYDADFVVDTLCQ